MNIIYPVCCGMDVHKKNVVATLLITHSDSTYSETTKTFSTMTGDLLRLREWLLQNNCPSVAMESTGKVLDSCLEYPGRFYCVDSCKS